MALAQDMECARQLAWLFRSRWWDEDAIEDYQRTALRSILRHAVTTVPHYRRLGISPESIGADGRNALSQFPQLTKSVVQQDTAGLRSSEFPLGELHRSMTSGSTGEPTCTWFDHKAWNLAKRALKLRRILEHAGGLPMRLLVVGEEPLRRPLRRLPSPVVLERLSIHESSAEQVAFIHRFRPTAVYGTPSWLQELVHSTGPVGLPRARVVWTSAEVLTPQAREEIEHGFGCPVRDVYGSTEFKEIAVECPLGRRHINVESSYVEVDTPNSEGVGALLVTSLINRGMPLIRFRLGDVGRLSSGRCACGRSSPALEGIGGREVELLELCGGRRLSPYLLSTAIETDPAIARYQLVQISERRIEVRYVPRDGGIALERTRLLERLRPIVGAEVEIEFQAVEAITRGPTGKHRILIRDAGAAVRPEER